ncbi:LysR family transcriptional regulator [Sagittula sp. SSi028]|uniref:LysR family transcriptional regulator n=1 Tax=Sagittula sp. SSi028 TaxID=3400636 RepID=UPI003AF58D4D
MPLPKLSLQVLEAFERVAFHGSVQAAATELGQSISAVSHHVSRLEEALGARLLDRSTRPFTLTREGRETLHHLTLGLRHLRRATTETMVVGLLGARSLRIGLIEDFEGTLAPDLAVTLAGRMPQANLSISNVFSHTAPDLLRRGTLDIAIATLPDPLPDDIVSYPILLDPFVLALPDSHRMGLPDLATPPDLPFLRFTPEHRIARQIEAHLSRNKITLPQRLTFDTVQMILAVVGNGDGWSIIPALGHLRAARDAGHVHLAPLPLPLIRRRIVLMTRADVDPEVASALADLLRDRIAHTITGPSHELYPWLARSFVVQDDVP